LETQKHKKTYISRQQIPGKYSTPSTGKETMFDTVFFQCPGMSQPLDSATPTRPPKVPFFLQERYVFMFLGEKNCACGHYRRNAEMRFQLSLLKLSGGKETMFETVFFSVSRYVSTPGQCYASQTSEGIFFLVGKVCFYVGKNWKIPLYRGP
jgi:hypothetical protein